MSAATSEWCTLCQSDHPEGSLDELIRAARISPESEAAIRRLLGRAAEARELRRQADELAMQAMERAARLERQGRRRALELAMRAAESEPPPLPVGEYSEYLPKRADYFVYRLWAADGSCLYVGMVGDNGPRELRLRLAEHKRQKPWWPDVDKIDAARWDAHQVHEEEIRQQVDLKPVHCTLFGRYKTPDAAMAVGSG